MRVSLALSAVLALAACGNEQQEKKESTTGGGATPVKTAVAGEPLDLETFEFGPYLAAALTGAADKQVSLEFGYIDVRQKKSEAAGGLFDFRWRQASVVASAGHLPDAPALNACADASSAAFTAGAPFGAEVTASGAAVGALAKGDDHVFRMEDKSGGGTAKIDLLKPLTVAVKDGPTVVSPKLATAGNVQMSGAFTGNVNINTNLQDLNDNLKSFATQDLTLTDVANGQDYDLIAITIYGGTAAKTRAMRCLLGPGGSVKLTSAQHQALYPIRGLFSVFANVEVKTEGGITTWTSGISGMGVDDLTVP